ncbi:hypothetical protein M9H77_02299 [Catharanthus roseus]|uniref:Uncharacterized protein n=1 Tax=Catharanthus roseus TaxID=4058 RepID=A0ACC0C8A8_CATRO|nr:hypothetical protein M9H77_02299 [Catharanthus roseus]
MVVYLGKALKAKKRCSSCFLSVQIARTKQRNKLEGNLAKYLMETTLPSTIGPTLLSLVAFWMDGLLNTASITDDPHRLSIRVLKLQNPQKRFFMKELAKNFEGSYTDLSVANLKRQEGLIMSTDGHMSSQSYQEGTSEPSMRHVNKTLWSIQQSIEGLERQYRSVVGDVEELKKGNSIQNFHPFHEGGYQGRPQGTIGRQKPTVHGRLPILAMVGSRHHRATGNKDLDLREMTFVYYSPLISVSRDENMEFDDAIEARLAALLEQGAERMTVAPYSISNPCSKGTGRGTTHTLTNTGQVG